jgi:hypothetical protein
MVLTTTVILPILEFLFTISVVLVISEAKLVALIRWVSVTINSLTAKSVPAVVKSYFLVGMYSIST